MVLDGVLLGAATWLSFVFTFRHSSNWFKRFCIRHAFIADVAAAALCYVLLAGISGTLVAVIAMITAGLGVNLSLIHAANRKEQDGNRNKTHPLRRAAARRHKAA